VRARAVISNADLLLTLERLVGPEHLEPAALAPLRRLRPTYPCFLTHVGIEGVPDDVLEEAQGYYWDSWDMDRVGVDALRCKIFAPTLYEPAMAPPGRQIVILQKVLEMDYGGVEDWPAHKARVEAFLLDHLEQRIPGISKRIVVKSSASARTSWRFTLNHQGAMLGWEMSPDQLGEGRPDVSGSIRNLFFVGHWTRPGGGITPVIVSAQDVARRVISSLR
jgi:phytoene dehydrogenase-like protein